MYPPPGANIMTLKWVYTVKTNGELKSRLVAREFKQIYGMDYHETFSPVAKLVTLRIVLSLAAAYDLELGCMDIKTAFLNAPIEPIEEYAWVRPPLHLSHLIEQLLDDPEVAPDMKVKIRDHLERLSRCEMLKLLLALYGTKQAGRNCCNH